MARFINDQNKVVFQNESGTYANTSGPGIWPGLVTSNEIEDAENLIETHFLGTGDRNYDVMDQGPRDVTGTTTYHPQNMRMMFWAMGSVADTSGTRAVHKVTEINTDVRQNVYTSGTLNPPKSWTIEDSKQSPGTNANFIRTIKGVVPTNTTLTAAQGERVTIEQEWVGQTLTVTSGTTTALTEVTTPSYLWSDGNLTIGGSTIQTAKEISLEVNQNMEPPHYVNGSRDISVPIPLNREYTLSVTMDMNHPESLRIYKDFYKGGSEFNTTFELNADNRGQIGSQHTVFSMSGCNIISMEIPTTNEGASESTIEIRPNSLNAIDFTNGQANALYAKV